MVGRNEVDLVEESRVTNMFFKVACRSLSHVQTLSPPPGTAVSELRLVPRIQTLRAERRKGLRIQGFLADNEIFLN